MRELKSFLKLVWTLLLIVNYLEKPKWARASDLNSDLNLDWNRDLDWMETGTLGMIRSGRWLRSSVCPAGSFVTGYTIKYGRGENKGEVTGLSLRCSELDEEYKLKQVRILNSNGATFSTQNNESTTATVTSNRYAVGFSIARWTDAQGFEFVGGRALTFFGEDFKSQLKFPLDANATLLVTVGCPDDWAICGVQARQSESGSESDTEGVLTKLRFKCCYYCIPQEIRLTLVDYTNPGSTDFTLSKRTTSGIQLDQRISSSRSNSQDLDWTKELQTGNSESLTNSASETDGETTGSSTGQSTTAGWQKGEELRISSSDQKTNDSRTTNSRTNTNSDSLSTGKSKSNTKGSHWSKSEGSLSSHSGGFEIGLGVKSKVEGGFGPFGIAGVEKSLDIKGNYNYNNQNSEDSTNGGNDQTENRESDDKSRTNTTGHSTDIQSGTSDTNLSGRDQSENSGQSGGNSSSTEQSRQKTIQKAKERSIQKGAQSSLTLRGNRRNSWQSNWDQADTSLWREEREDTYTFTCEAMHRCKIEQLYLTCGALRIGSNRIEKKIDQLKYGQHGITPIPVPNNHTNPTEIQWDITIPGETWVVAKDFSFWEPSGRWENIQVCSPDTIVSGHSFKNMSRIGLTGISLLCSEKYGPDKGNREHDDVNILQISYKDEPRKNITRGRYDTVYRGSRSVFATGFSFARTEMNGRRAIGNHEMLYHNIKPMEIPRKLIFNSTRVTTKCPEDHAICGVTAMMDKDGLGFITAMGFRCCHHCIPEENWEVVTSWDKTGPSEEKRKVTTTIGMQRTSSTVQSQSQNIGNTVDSAGIRAGFSARFGLSNSTGFDWSRTSTAIWSNKKQTEDTYICEPYSKCVYKELVGQCGSVHVHANKFIKESTSLVPVIPGTQFQPTSTLSPEPEPELKQEPEPKQQGLADHLVYLDGEETPVEVLKNGEIWIEARSIQERIGSGAGKQQEQWGSTKSCPFGAFVTGYKFQNYGGENKDTQHLIKEISLQCSTWNESGEFEQVDFIPGDPRQRRGQGRGQRRGQSSGQGENWSNLIQDEYGSPAVGFHYFVYERANGNGEMEQGTTLPDLLFYREQTPNAPEFPNTDGEINSLPRKILCPKDYVICGVGTRKEGSTGIILDVKFRCCYHCEPYEEMKELGRRENPRDTQIFYTIEHVSVGAAVQVKKPLEEGRTAHTFTLLPGFSDYEYIQHMFSHRLPRKPKSKSSSPSRVNWLRQRADLWKKEIEITIDSHCDPEHKCAVYQIIGVCGQFRIPTHITKPLSKLISDSSSFEEEDE